MRFITIPKKEEKGMKKGETKGEERDVRSRKSEDPPTVSFDTKVLSGSKDALGSTRRLTKSSISPYNRKEEEEEEEEEGGGGWRVQFPGLGD